MKFFILSIFLGITYAFTPNILLNGPVGERMTAYSVPKSISYKYIKKYEIEQIQKDSPVHICNELRDVKEKLRSDNNNINVSFFMDNESKHIFTIIYRLRTQKLPIIYNIETILRTPGVKMKSNDIQCILKQMVNDRKGYIQLQELKRWSNGKYNIENYLENQIVGF